MNPLDQPIIEVCQPIHTPEIPYCSDPLCPCRDEVQLGSPDAVIASLRAHTARLAQIKDEHLEHPTVRAYQIAIFALDSIWASLPDGTLKQTIDELTTALQHASL